MWIGLRLSCVTRTLAEICAQSYQNLCGGIVEDLTKCFHPKDAPVVALIVALGTIPDLFDLIHGEAPLVFL